MRPLLIVVTLVLLVVASLLTGVVASDWPFWQRAWRWHAAAPAIPARLPGAHAWLASPGEVRELPADADPAISAAVSSLLGGEATEALLVARDDRLLFEYYGPRSGPGARFDSRELSMLPLVALYGAAAERGVGTGLDGGVATQFDEWREDPRGSITPRQLLQGLSGLEAARGEWLNPFGRAARLASGPNFERAALGFRRVWPAGSHYAANPVDAQLAGAALARSVGQPLSSLLDSWLIEPLGLDSVQVLLDRHRGQMAAHCCVRARARDWLTIGLLFAQKGVVAGERVYPERFATQIESSSPVAPQRALGMERVGLAHGGTGLLVGGRQRMLLADPATRTVWLWISAEDFQPAQRVALVAAAGGAQRQATTALVPSMKQKNRRDSVPLRGYATIALR